MTHYKLSNLGKRNVALASPTDEDKLKPLTDLGSGQARDPHQVLLSEIVEKMNDLFEGELDENDKLALVNHVAGKMLDNVTLSQQAAANTKEQFGASPDYKHIMLESVAEGLDKYQDMAKQVLNSPKVQDGLASMLLELVYAEFAKRRENKINS
jgi:type I restriction enzyme R subunit